MSNEPKNDGGPAFPQNHSNFAQDGRCTSIDWLPGMTLRDWFAGQALAAVFNASSSGSGLASLEKRMKASGKTAPREVADMVYMLADAMLEARKRDE